MKRILVIAYYWPPASGPGVQRWLKFVKFLVQEGWEPIVLTVKNGSYPAMDETLLAEVPDSVKVYRSTSLEPHLMYNFLRGEKGKKTNVGLDQSTKSSNKLTQAVQSVGMYFRSNVFIPDARIGWNRSAIRLGKKIIKDHKPEYLVTTGPPHSVHLTGLALKKNHDIKWLADFRDPWTNAYYNQSLKRSERARKKDIRLENSVLMAADAISVVSPGMKEEFADRSDNIAVLYNGYDQEDFPQELQKQSSSAKNFVLQYVGSYKTTEIHLPLWNALAELINESASFSSDFRMCFTGNITEAVKNSIHTAGLSTYTDYKGFVAHDEAVLDMKKAPLLLFIVADLPGSHKVVTGKIFEYLASGSPILGIGEPNGGADEVLRSCDHPGLLPYDAKELYKNEVLREYKSWKQSGRIPNRYKNYEQYSRLGITKKLIHLLDSLS